MTEVQASIFSKIAKASAFPNKIDEKSIKLNLIMSNKSAIFVIRKKEKDMKTGLKILNKVIGITYLVFLFVTIFGGMYFGAMGVKMLSGLIPNNFWASAVGFFGIVVLMLIEVFWVIFNTISDVPEGLFHIFDKRIYYK